MAEFFYSRKAKNSVDRERTLVTGHSFFPTMPGNVGRWNKFQYLAASVGIWDLNGFAVEVGASPTVFGDVR